jgi:hypothetical protein
MMEKLRGAPSPNEKVRFASLLVAVKGYTGEIEDWCVTELARATNDLLPEVGLDITSGVRWLIPQKLREFSKRPTV